MKNQSAEEALQAIIREALAIAREHLDSIKKGMK